jgi:4-amino-4-deoxy-L-arabinose transferase-like glycosyltransferase
MRFWRIFVAAAAIFSLFFLLGARGLNEPDEGRFSEVGREMAATGNYVTPHLEGVRHLSKPPMTYWLIAASIKIFGVNEFAARLPAALAALGTLLAVFFLTRSAFDETTALWSVVILLSSALFFAVAHIITTDMILTCFVTWSVWFLWRWHVSDDKSWRKIAWFYAFLGLGMMTKGPVAVILPLFSVLGLRWKNKNFALRQMCWGRGMLIFLAISVPWFVAVAQKNPAIWHYFLVRESVERLATGVHHRSKPFWYFVPVLAGGFLPWSVLLPAAARALRGKTGREADLVRLCGAWAIVGLVFFSLSRSKLPTYVLPLCPPLAMLTAAGLTNIFRAKLLERGDVFVRGSGLVAALILGAAAIGLAVMSHGKYGVAHAHVGLVVLAAAAGAALCIALLAIKRAELFAAAVTISTLSVFLAAIWILPSVEQQLRSQTSGKFFATTIRDNDPKGEIPVICYRSFQYTLPFYLERTVLLYQPVVKGTQASEEVFEFRGARTGSSGAILNSRQARELFTGDKPVFCIVQIADLAALEDEFGVQMYALQHVGNRVLTTNRRMTQRPTSDDVDDGNVP